MKVFLIQFVILIFSASVFSQSTFGLEIRTSRNVTHNSSKIVGGSYGLGGYKVTKEGNPMTFSYSIALVFSPNTGSMLKIHVGRHQNGRIIDLTEYDDTFSSYSYANVDLPYNYLQLIPSYAYNIVKGKFNLPFELGLAINKRINEADIFFLGITEYNFDIRISSGFHYKMNEFSIGSNLVFSKSIKNYATKSVNGKYKPYQFGVELSIGYFFKS
ncbi:MAG: hypothetical protein IPN29_02645 [Saprospiraceae bacterium]|nr:hypothetical protein [Saprospiraceae bacterium]